MYKTKTNDDLNILILCNKCKNILAMSVLVTLKRCNMFFFQHPQLHHRFGLTEAEADDRGYVFENNPNVQMFTDAANGDNFDVQLAINTAQLGRTFQDRYTFCACDPRGWGGGGGDEGCHSPRVSKKKSQKGVFFRHMVSQMFFF